MNFLHEGMKVDAALVRYGQAVVEQVHQHGFSAPNAAPQIEPARRRRLLAKQPAQQAAGLPCFKILLQLRKAHGGRALLRIGPQFAGSNQRFVPRQQSGHLAEGLRTMPEKVATRCASSSP